MTTSIEKDWSSLTRLVLPVLVLYTAASLRFYSLEVMEFRGDQADHHEALLGVLEGNIPLCGHRSSPDSKSMMFPPWFYYALIPGLIFGDSPLTLAGVSAASGVLAVMLCGMAAHRIIGRGWAIIPALLMATNAWAVLETRKLWAPDLMCFFATLSLYCCLLFMEKPRAWTWALALTVLCVTAQVHYSGVPLCAAVPVMWLLMRRRIPLKWWLCAAGACFLTALPFIIFESGSGFEDVAKFFGVVGGKTAREPTFRGFRFMLEILGMAGIPEYYLGPTTSELSEEFLALPKLAGVLGGSLLIIGTIMLISKLRTIAPSSNEEPEHAPAQGGGHESLSAAGNSAEIILLVFLLAPPLMFYSEPLQRCYFFVGMPAIFITVGMALKSITDGIKAKGMPAARWPALFITAILAGGGVMMSSEYIRLVNRLGGAAGPTGPSYANKLQMAEYLGQRAASNPILLADFSYPPLIEQVAADHDMASAIVAANWTGGLPHLIRFLNPAAQVWKPGMQFPDRAYILINKAAPPGITSMGRSHLVPTGEVRDFRLFEIREYRLELGPEPSDKVRQ
ncbi:MAG TPA: hypothetical protein PL033_01400 [Candidatus Brocadiia bacterium]|nr:hypothetical protein [Candidatus Brocadiia bacterium]